MQTAGGKKMYEDESYIDRVDWSCPEKYFDLYIIESRKTVFCFGKEIKITKATWEVLFDFIEYRKTIKYIEISEYAKQKEKPIDGLQKRINRLNNNVLIVRKNKKIIGNKNGIGYFLNVSSGESGVLVVD